MSFARGGSLGALTVHDDVIEGGVVQQVTLDYHIETFRLPLRLTWYRGEARCHAALDQDIREGQATARSRQQRLDQQYGKYR